MRRVISVAAFVLCGSLLGAAPRQDASWTQEFGVERSELASTGRNPWFILEPGYALTFEHERERLVITVLAQTRVVDGVETRVVEERETNAGKLVEISRNFYAI